MTVDGTRVRQPGLVVVVAFMGALAGHFTLSRIGLEIPLFDDLRVPLFAALLMCAALELRQAPARSHTGVPCLLAILAFLGYQAISAAWAPPTSTLPAALGDLAAIAVLIVVYVVLAEWDRDRVVTVTLGCFYATAWIYFLAAAAGLSPSTTGRWAAPGGGPNVFVRIMALGMLAAVYLYVRKGHRLVWLLGVPAFLTGAVASGSRGGLIALVITVVLAAPALAPRLRLHGAKPLLMVAGLLGAGWLFAGDAIVAFVEERFFAATFEEGYTSNRDILFRAALQMFLQRPFTGTGITGFSALANLGIGEKYAHNLLLAVASEGGAIGVVLLLNALYQLRREFARVPPAERSLESRMAAYCGIYMTVAGMFSGDYYDARLMWIMLVLAAVRPALKLGYVDRR
jgi:O-antigen ligase